jgi:hypothetical protein
MIVFKVLGAGVIFDHLKNRDGGMPFLGRLHCSI